MIKRDFFRVLIKIFGVYLFITTLFSYIPFSVFRGITIINTIIIIATGLLVLFLSFFLVFRPDAIINLLKLDKGFDSQKVDFGNLNKVHILQIAILIISGIIIISNYPAFLKHCYLAFESKFSRDPIMLKDDHLDPHLYSAIPIDYFSWAMSAINLIIGYLLIRNYDKVAQWLLRKE